MEYGKCPNCDHVFPLTGEAVICPNCGMPLVRDNLGHNPGQEPARVLAAYRGHLRGLPHVTGTYSTPEAIVVLLQQEVPPGTIPSEMEGVPIITRVVGKMRPMVTVPVLKDRVAYAAIPSQERHRPLLGGISIGPPGGYTGTLAGIFVIKGKSYLLSNSHVFHYDGFIRGDPIVQPGSYDAGGVDDIVGELWCYTGFSYILDNYVDAALAIPLVEVTSDILIDGPVPMGGILPASVGDSVGKCGRTTGYTTGIVTATDAELDVEMPDGSTIHYADQLIIESPTPMAGLGDSGSLIFIPGVYEVYPCGLLFAGDEAGTLIAANKIDRVLATLEEMVEEVPVPGISLMTLLMVGTMAIGVVNLVLLARRR